LNNDIAYPPLSAVVDAIGFGATTEGGSQSSILLMTQVVHISNALCRAAYPAFIVNEAVMLCARADGKDR
jgi:hypothetical protein